MQSGACGKLHETVDIGVAAGRDFHEQALALLELIAALGRSHRLIGVGSAVLASSAAAAVR